MLLTNYINTIAITFQRYSVRYYNYCLRIAVILLLSFCYANAIALIEVATMDFYKRITYLREEKGITVNRLANLAGISQSFLREIELGVKKPSIETLSYICDALEISLKDFFDDDLFKQFPENELLKEIYKLTPEQRKLLLQLLKSFQK